MSPDISGRRFQLVPLGLALGIGAVCCVGVARWNPEPKVAPDGVFVRLHLPYAALGRTETIFAARNPEVSTEISISYLKDGKIRLNAVTANQEWQSLPFAVDKFISHSLSAFYERDGAWPEDKRLMAGGLKVTFDGRLVIGSVPEIVPSFPAVLQDHAIPFRDPVRPWFRGPVDEVKSIEEPLGLEVGPERRVDLKIRFPAAEAEVTEPIASLLVDGKPVLLFVKYLAGSRLAFGYVPSEGGPAIYSQVTSFKATSAYRLGFYCGYLPSREMQPAVRVWLDGVNLFSGKRLFSSTNPIVAVIGANKTRSQLTRFRFTGDFGGASQSDRAADTLKDESVGPLHLVVKFPTNMASLRDPILVSGVTGAGDLVYVIYSDATHVRFGYDHWCAPGYVSDPVLIDYEKPHDVVVRLGSPYHSSENRRGGEVYPGGPGSNPTGRVSVQLDGVTVLDKPATPYLSSLANVTVGRNAIGGSTCDAEFRGHIYFVERLGADE